MNNLQIGEYGGVGGLWINQPFRIYPKFYIHTEVFIPKVPYPWNVLWWEGYWSMDGFAMILSQTKPPYANGEGGNIGYSNIYNALVIEVDLFYNSELGDINSNSLSLHRCYGSFCGPQEGSTTTQRNLPIVNFLY